jgi:hypothetical protein
LAVTVSATVVVAVNLPEVPVMVKVAVPTVAVLLAVSVRTLVPVVGLVPKEAVTPLGRPVAVRVALPENPFSGVRVMVDVPEALWTMLRDAGDAASVKLGAGLSVRTTVAVAVVLSVVFVGVNVAVNV